jgi:hypothetical protein
MGKVDFRRLHELYSSDIKLTDELYYTPDEKEFFHSSPGVKRRRIPTKTRELQWVTFTENYVKKKSS